MKKRKKKLFINSEAFWKINIHTQKNFEDMVKNCRLECSVFKLEREFSVCEYLFVFHNVWKLLFRVFGPLNHSMASSTFRLTLVDISEEIEERNFCSFCFMRICISEYSCTLYLEQVHSEARGGCWIPCSWSSTQVNHHTWVLGSKLGPSTRTACSLSHWAISPCLRNVFLKAWITFPTTTFFM